MPNIPFQKRLEELVAFPIREASPTDAYREVIAMLKREADLFYEAVFAVPRISAEKFATLSDQHARLLDDIAIVAARLAILEGKPVPDARPVALRRPATTPGGYGER